MCDTFVALPAATADGSVIFGKNSDREPNEAQVLEHHPAGTYGRGDRVRCTYLTIPQVRTTYAVLLSRPFWMWGAEMGANEKGVVIGNEAVFTRLPVAKNDALTGMDLLRLALERAPTAARALETIVQLLADYGQGGACGYTDKRLRYHNSFILADPSEAWVLETAGPLWAALKVKGAYAISNALTIGETFDAAHPALIDTVREKGWLKRGETFHFARCLSDRFFTFFAAGGARRAAVMGGIEGCGGKLDVPAAGRLLRTHGPGPYHPDRHLLLDRPCAHAANPLTRFAAQTTASLVAHLTPATATFWATGTSAPCTGVFKPLWFGTGAVVPDIGPAPGAVFDPRALWWAHERLHRSLLQDFDARLAAYRDERDRLEAAFLEQATAVAPAQRWDCSESAFERARAQTALWTARLQAMPVQKRLRPVYRRFWHQQNRKAGIDLAA